MKIAPKGYKKVVDTQLARKLYPDYLDSDEGFIQIPVKGVINTAAKIIPKIVP